MSTASSGGVRGGTDAADPTPQTDRTVDATPAEVQSLAARAVAFSNAFERWSGRKALEAGATISRLQLLYRVHCHGPQKMADLADALMVTPRNVTALVDGLEGEGLVRRVPHSTDRRVTLVELSCESSRVASQFEAYQESLAALFAALDPDDRIVLGRVFDSLTARMRADACPPDGGRLDA